MQEQPVPSKENASPAAITSSHEFRLPFPMGPLLALGDFSPLSRTTLFLTDRFAMAHLSHKIGIYGLDDEESSPGSQKEFNFAEQASQERVIRERM
jgi:hypothetical protein